MGVGIEIAQDHKAFAGFEPAACAFVIIYIIASGSGDIIRPETIFVMIAFSVAVFFAIESGRRRMAGQHMHAGIADDHRDIPMAF